MLFTNHTSSKTFEREFIVQLNHCDKLLIASGYFGVPTLKKLEKKILAISRKGECKILIGMVFHQGVSNNQNLALTELDNKLKAINSSNGIFISRKQYHGKIYSFEKNGKANIYLGSSNFSQEGLKNRWECNIKVEDKNTINETLNYLDFLFSQPTTLKLEKANLLRSKTPLPKNILDIYEIPAKDFPKPPSIIGTCQIELRVNSQPASSLNLYFDKGRLNRSTGKYEPRPWYEIEITSTAKEIRNPYYPPSTPVIKKNGKATKSRKGTFNAFLAYNNKFYKIQMKVSSDNGKALFSGTQSGGRATLGKIIKGQLESSGLLKRNQLITSDILEAYGKKYIELKKIDDDNYILEF